MDQDELIIRFVGFYNAILHNHYRVTRWPDKEPGGTGEIDAIAEREGSPDLAIEHTLVQTYIGQKEADHRFLSVMGELPEALEPVDDHVTITTPSSPIPTKTSWDEIRQRIIEYFQVELSKSPEGRSVHTIEGVPFRVEVNRWKSLRPGVYLSCFAPSDLGEVVNMKKALLEKTGKLEKYAKAETILLLESEDIALTNETSLYMAFLQAEVDVPHYLDQIWLASSFEGRDEVSCNFLCFRGPRDVMERANPDNFKIHPDNEEYWWEEIRKGR